MKRNKRKVEVMQDRISQLIYRAETFLNYSDKLVCLYEESRKNKIDMTNPAMVSLRLHHILYMNEVLLILASIFESRRNKSQEISFNSYCDLLVEEKIPPEIGELSDSYWKGVIPKIRNRIIAHKQKNSIGDPCTGFINCYSHDVIGAAREILNKTKKYVSENFDVAVNNYVESLYAPGFDFYFNYLQRNLS